MYTESDFIGHLNYLVETTLIRKSVLNALSYYYDQEHLILMRDEPEQRDITETIAMYTKSYERYGKEIEQLVETISEQYPPFAYSEHLFDWNTLNIRSKILDYYLPKFQKYIRKQKQSLRFQFVPKQPLQRKQTKYPVEKRYSPVVKWKLQKTPINKPKQQYNQFDIGEFTVAKELNDFNPM